MNDHDHTVKSYDSELAVLDGKIARMGGLVELLLAHALDALDKRDPDLAETTIEEDQAIDQLENEIEEQAISMIARRQPMAQDLRQIIGAIKIASDLERIGDLGKNIAKRAMAISNEGRPKQLMHGLDHMGDLALEQLKNILDAYATRDAGKAHQVWLRDREIDAMYNSIFRELLTYMMEDPRNIGLCTHLLFGAKNIERIGDHTTNIAETCHFLIHGEQLADDRPKKDETSTMNVSPDSRNGTH